MKSLKKPSLGTKEEKSCKVQVAVSTEECEFYDLDEGCWECQTHGDEVYCPEEPAFCRSARYEAKKL